MAKLTKDQLIAKGKELGINLKKAMSVYEMEKRIEEAEQKTKSKENEPKKVQNKSRGEY